MIISFLFEKLCWENVFNVTARIDKCVFNSLLVIAVKLIDLECQVGIQIPSQSLNKR